MTTNQQLLDRLIQFYEDFGRSPARADISNATYQRRFGTWNNALKAAGLPINSERGDPVLNKSCIVCSTITKNPKFCSKTCAAKHNNSVKPKRQRVEAFCKGCEASISNRRSFCNECNPHKYRKSADYTLLEIKNRYNGHLNKFYSFINADARKVYKDSGRPRDCSNCGYSKHTQISHIKSVSKLPDSSTVREVNDIDNLMALCPNCHWEFDHRFLSTSKNQSTTPTSRSRIVSTHTVYVEVHSLR